MGKNMKRLKAFISYFEISIALTIFLVKRTAISQRLRRQVLLQIIAFANN